MWKALYSVIAVTSSCRRHDRSTASGWRPHGRRNSCPSSRIHLFVTEIQTNCTVFTTNLQFNSCAHEKDGYPRKFIHAEWWKRLVASELRASDSNKNCTTIMHFLMAYCYCIVNIVDFLSTYPIFVQAAPDSRRVPCFYRIHPTALRCTKMLHRSVKAHTSHISRTCSVIK